MEKDVFFQLMQVLFQRRDALQDSPEKAAKKASYVHQLMKKGPEAINQKVEEESQEVQEVFLEGNKAKIIHESADLFFHVMVGMAYHGVTWEELAQELERRFGISGMEEKANRKT